MSLNNNWNQKDRTKSRKTKPVIRHRFHVIGGGLPVGFTVHAKDPVEAENRARRRVHLQDATLYAYLCTDCVATGTAGKPRVCQKPGVMVVY